MNAATEQVPLHEIRALAKAEVHVHLEGSIELADLVLGAREAGVALPGPAATLFDPSTHDVRPGTQTSPLSTFLDFLDWEGSLFTTAEQIERLAYRFAARQSESGIRITDVIVNPTHWPAWSSRVADLFDALGSGFAQAEADGLCSTWVCASILRTQSAAEAEELVETLVTRGPQRLVGLSIDGDERSAGRTSARFAEAFHLAGRHGLKRTVHAGESSGPEGVWDAIDLLGAERIDHGVRAIEDPRLVERLATDGISLGVCPGSNLALGLYERLAEHPVAALMDAGVRVTINTDDPVALGTRLDSEWALCASTFGWGRDRILDLAHTSVQASFAPEELRERVAAELPRIGASA